MGWAIKSCRDKIVDVNSLDYQLLDQMICLEKDVSEAYMKDWYDLYTLMQNVGGKERLSLVADFFLLGGKGNVAGNKVDDPRRLEEEG